MKKRILMSIAVLATMMASVIATSACYFATYQPEEPKCLREE
ncbi:cyclic lactone autoinducer peptide [Clostridium sp.]|nr:cyclic lactone autoinducer peptide [Clostridium sp.]